MTEEEAYEEAEYARTQAVEEDAQRDYEEEAYNRLLMEEGDA